MYMYVNNAVSYAIQYCVVVFWRIKEHHVLVTNINSFSKPWIVQYVYVGWQAIAICVCVHQVSCFGRVCSQAAELLW